MKTVFIDRKNSELEVDRGRLIVKIPDIRPNFSIPTNIIEMLVISASVQFSSTLMTQLTSEKIVVLFINPRKMEGNTLTTGMMHNDAARRLKQYQILSNEEIRLFYAKKLMEHKIRLQKIFLKKAITKRLDCRYPLTKALKIIIPLLFKVDSANSVESLRGLEGAASAAYFEGYQSLFAPHLEFNGRNRRPPLDPVNVMLSLTFTLLHAEAIRALFSVGFDPMLGIYHEPLFGRESLACDLVELFRPYAEQWIWRLFADETIRAEHFSKEKIDQGMPCILGKRGREIYYAEYDIAARVWRRLMRNIVRHWWLEIKNKSDF